jgi:hypothetical protein
MNTEETIEVSKLEEEIKTDKYKPVFQTYISNESEDDIVIKIDSNDNLEILYCLAMLSKAISESLKINYKEMMDKIANSWDGIEENVNKNN